MCLNVSDPPYVLVASLVDRTGRGGSVLGLAEEGNLECRTIRGSRWERLFGWITCVERS